MISKRLAGMMPRLSPDSLVYCAWCVQPLATERAYPLPRLHDVVGHRMHTVCYAVWRLEMQAVEPEPCPLCEP